MPSSSAGSSSRSRPFENRLTIVSGLENRHAYGPVHAITPGTWLSGVSPRSSSDSSQGVDGRSDRGAAHRSGHACCRRSKSPPRSQRGSAPAPGKVTTARAMARRSRFARPSHAAADGIQPAQALRQRCSLRARRPTSAPMRARRRRASSISSRRMPRACRSGSALRTGRAPRLPRHRARRRASCGEGGSGRCCRASMSPADTAHAFAERMNLMFDMTALAFRADITRVASFMMAAETSHMTYDHVGVPEPFHLLSHHQNDPAKIEKLVRIQTLPHARVRDVRSEARGAARRRRLDARSLADPLRQQHERQPRARSLPVAAGGDRRRLRQAARAASICAIPTARRCRTCCSRCSIAPACRWSRSATARASAPRSDRYHLGTMGSNPLFATVPAASDDARNLMSARAASGFFEPAATPAENTVTL